MMNAKYLWITTGCLALLSLPVQANTQTLELSLDQCVKMTLKSNLSLAIERLSPQLSKQDLMRLQARYGPVLGADLSINQNVSPSSNSFISGGSILEQSRQSYNLSLDQPLLTGGQLSLSFDNPLNRTNSTRADLNPAINPQFSLNFSQPLLRSAMNDWRELDIQANQYAQAELALQNQILQSIADAQQTYWALVRTRERLKVQKNALKQLNELLVMNQAKEKAGFLSKIDLQQTEARIALREAQLLDAERQQRNLEDRLKQLLNPHKNSQVTWATQVVPTEQPNFELKSVSFEDSYQRALKYRPDWQTMNYTLKNADLRVKIAGQNLWPQLNLQTRAGLESLADNYPQALGQLFNFQTYFWQAGLNFEVPVVQNQYWEALRRAQLDQKQTQLQQDLLRQNIEQDLRQAVRDVTFNAQRVKAFRLAQKLAENQLKAQTEKLSLGLSTNFQVLQFQSDFESASLSEVNAVIDYILSLTQLRLTEGYFESFLKPGDPA